MNHLSRTASDLLDLPVFELQWRWTAENRRDDPHHSLIRNDFIDNTLEVDEGAVGHLDLVALLVFGAQRRSLLGSLGLFDHLLLILGAHRSWLAVGADEIANTLGLLDHEPDVLGDRP